MPGFFMFRTNGYVQDERYIAIEHMDVRRDCVSFAQCQMDSAYLEIDWCFVKVAKVARYLSSGLAVNTSMYALARHPCRSRS